MSDVEQIEQDLRKYLDQESNLRSEDKLKYLMAVCSKHFTFDKLDHIINDNDIFDIISRAKSAYANTRLPMTISGKIVRGDDIGNILLIESFICYLNKMNLLSKFIKVDKKD